MHETDTTAKVASTAELGVSSLLQRLPRGEVMATGVVGGIRVELVRYTEEAVKNRDAQWRYELERERAIANEMRCRMFNLEMDLRRVLDGERTLCNFAILDELRQRLYDA